MLKALRHKNLTDDMLWNKISCRDILDISNISLGIWRIVRDTARYSITFNVNEVAWRETIGARNA